MLKFNTYYHIYNHANGIENIFCEDKNYSFFLSKVKLYIEPTAEIIAWCLMPNHFHLVVKIRSEEEIIKNYSSSTSLSFLKFLTLEKIEKINSSASSSRTYSAATHSPSIRCIKGEDLYL